jgi:hypothetical protein
MADREAATDGTKSPGSGPAMNAEILELELESPNAGCTLVLSSVPKTWSNALRVRVEGPATLEKVTIGRTYFEPGDGLEAHGFLTRDAHSHEIGPGALLRVIVKTTGQGQVKALVDVEPLAPAGRYGESQ